MATILGKNATNFKYFCLFYECDKKHRYNINKTWFNDKNKKGKNLYNFI